MISWLAFRTYIRNSVLNDALAQAPRPNRWTEENIYDFTKAAMRAFCSHTAYVKEHEVEDFIGDTIELPTDVYDDFGNTAYVEVILGSARPVLYRSVYHTPNISPSATGKFFIVLNNSVLRFTEPFTKAVTVRMRYFATYPEPAAVDDDAFNLLIPTWAEVAIAYLVAAHAQSNFAMSHAQLARWAESPEKGTPEDNPFRVMNKWFITLYETEIARVAAQNRQNFWGIDE